MSSNEIGVRANPHCQLLSIDGEDQGGPYYLTVNRGLSPVYVSRLPVWAAGWPNVFAALRAVLSAFEFERPERAPTSPEASSLWTKRAWKAAGDLARAGQPVTCWSILARLHPEPRAPKARRWPVGRVLTHDPSTGEPVIVYGGTGPLGLVGGTVIIGGRR